MAPKGQQEDAACNIVLPEPDLQRADLTMFNNGRNDFELRPFLRNLVAIVGIISKVLLYV